jgi:hypothetical protein
VAGREGRGLKARNEGHVRVEPTKFVSPSNLNIIMVFYGDPYEIIAIVNNDSKNSRPVLLTRKMRKIRTSDSE